MNNGFAIRPLSPLGYAAVIGSTEPVLIVDFQSIHLPPPGQRGGRQTAMAPEGSSEMFFRLPKARPITTIQG